LLEGNTVAAATAELIRILRKERAWVRLEDAVERVERAERLCRELTRELDRWRTEPAR
jgi:exonuclease VII small subunit